MIDKKLVRSLTPEGRGQVVTHGLYKDRELDSLNTRFVEAAAAGPADADDMDESPVSPVHRSTPSSASPPPRNDSREQFQAMQAELSALRQDVEQLKQRLDALEN